MMMGASQILAGRHHYLVARETRTAAAAPARISRAGKYAKRKFGMPP